jgi:hypothetical protein
MKEVVRTANEVTTEILQDKGLNLAEINHPIHAAARIITEEVNVAGATNQKLTDQNIHVG